MRRALTPGVRCRKAGLTLLEIVVVAGIMVLLLSITLTSSVDWGRLTGMRTSLETLEAGLGMARQFAVTRNRRALFTYGNTNDPPGQRGTYIVSNATGVVLDNRAFLARGVAFTGPDDASIAFRADGGCRSDVGTWSGGYRDLVLEEDAREEDGLIRTVRVWRTTGMAEILD